MNTSRLDQFFNSVQQTGDSVSNFFGLLRPLGFLISFVFLAIIIYSIVGLINLKYRSEKQFAEHFIKKNRQRASESLQNKHWKQLKEAISSPNEKLWRIALIDADTMLEEAVTNLGYTGETFGEKLKQISRSEVAWIDAAWEVHRLRNTLAHEGGHYRLSQREAYRSYKIYESILYEINYLS